MMGLKRVLREEDLVLVPKRARAGKGRRARRAPDQPTKRAGS